MEQERNIVLSDIKVAVVDLGGPRHVIELLGGDLGTVGVVENLAGGWVLMADAEDLVEGLAVGILDDREVELTAADEVDSEALVEGFVGRGGDGWADESDLDRGICLLNNSGHLLIALSAHAAGEEDEELVILEDLDDLLPIDVVGWRIEEAGALQHAGRISEPNGVPVGLDLAGGQRELAPPSNFSKEGGFRKRVFRGFVV
jgi:hypothetical protein